MTNKDTLKDRINLISGRSRKVLNWNAYWHILKRRKWLVIAPAILSILFGFFITLFITPIYKSSTTILVSDSNLMTRSTRSIVPGQRKERNEK